MQFSRVLGFALVCTCVIVRDRVRVCTCEFKLNKNNIIIGISNLIP